MLTFFSYLCDAAILEEAGHRLGKKGAMMLVGVRDNQFYLYRTRLAKGERLPTDARRKLIEALMGTLKPEEVDAMRLQRIEEKLDRALKEYSPQGREGMTSRPGLTIRARRGNIVYVNFRSEVER